ncbi:LAMI_0H07646g1_1 [Lachancea mirantina]|uniref:LAMI_0H07646g1_1 n=1 Tax=Lachancea mirantina TaxID=1230905 RepID=A0A1G4KFW4_9SACH|nr:LAMI_0H07646g1_1 [Lachancea mirantina]
MSLWGWSKKRPATLSSSDAATDANAGQRNSVKGSKKVPLKDSPRAIESQFGESLGLRTRVLQKLVRSGCLGIGPPDLVHTTQYDGLRHKEIGEFHYIIGLDVSSEAAPIAYLNALKLTGTGFRNDGLVSCYCSMNIFSKVDIKIRYESEKHYLVNAIECMSGTTNVNLSEELWDETLVSAFIRSMIIGSEPDRKLPGLVEVAPGMGNGISYCHKLLTKLFRFLPRGVSIGHDVTKGSHATYRNNYLTEAILIFLGLAKTLVPHAVRLLDNLIKEDPDNELCYRTVLIAVVTQSESFDQLAVENINETMSLFFKQADLRIEQRMIDPLTDVLCMQAAFLLSKNDFDLALPVAQKATRLSSDSFEAWECLAKCYIGLRNYEQALIAVNAMPQLPASDDCKAELLAEKLENYYYQRPLGRGPSPQLQAAELDYVATNLKLKDRDIAELVFGRIVMPRVENRGSINELWTEACALIGPVYGPQSCTLANFVSMQEINSLKDTELLARNTIANQLSWSLRRVYDLLMTITEKIGWNTLLDLRSTIFVMQREYQVSATSTATVYQLRQKRLCERWLDTLFLDLYSDLKIAKHASERKNNMLSGLEWELLGLTLARTHHWSEAIACLRTSIVARFDIVSAEELVQIYLRDDLEPTELPDTEIMLDILLQKLSYESRFYNYFQISNLQLLAKLATFQDVDAIRHQLHVLPRAESGIVALTDQFLDYIYQFSQV